MALVRPKQCTMRAYTHFATRQADELLWPLVLLADAQRLCDGLCLPLLELLSGLGKGLHEVRGFLLLRLFLFLLS